ncbi:MAG: HU family DNA-binding protein, partial [Bacteroidota bacterium]
MNKAQLVEAIASEAKLTKVQANLALKAFVSATT